MCVLVLEESKERQRGRWVRRCFVYGGEACGGRVSVGARALEMRESKIKEENMTVK